MRIGNKIRVRVWQNSYYPCGYQLQAVSDKITGAIVKVACYNGRSNNEPMAVSDTMPDFVPVKKQKYIERGWDIVCLVDPWEFAHYYGFDSHTIFDKAGKTKDKTK